MIWLMRHFWTKLFDAAGDEIRRLLLQGLLTCRTNKEEHQSTKSLLTSKPVFDASSPAA